MALFSWWRWRDLSSRHFCGQWTMSSPPPLAGGEASNSCHRFAATGRDNYISLQRARPLSSFADLRRVQKPALHFCGRTPRRWHTLSLAGLSFHQCKPRFSIQRYRCRRLIWFSIEPASKDSSAKASTSVACVFCSPSRTPQAEILENQPVKFPFALTGIRAKVSSLATPI